MKRILILCLLVGLSFRIAFSQNLEQLWATPADESKSWVFWYWMHGAITKEGITADIEAMKEIGLQGAYLMPIHGVPEKPFITPSVVQLSPLWWQMVDFAMKEADRVGLKIAFHVCDGFALAGGPWITPELSMQKLVWSQTFVEGEAKLDMKLAKPQHFAHYYNDIALYAYPTMDGEDITSQIVVPKVTSSVDDSDIQFLADETTDGTFRSEEPCWIQYSFPKPFTARTIQVERAGNNFQSQRLVIQASDDGISFREISKLVPPRQGWQEVDFAKLGREYPITHSIPETTARHFRFLYDKSGTEPGSEDLDAAKWKQSLKIKKIVLLSATRIHQHEGKSGLAWRVAARTTEQQITNSQCVDPSKLIDISKYLDKETGTLSWNAPKGNWTILRMGHTSNGYDNGTGGGGAGLECDKFNPEAIRLQFNSWFGKAVEVAGKDLASRVLKVFHVDSWECGSQNWSPVFREEFKQRRGYDIYDYLPAMAGIPIESADKTERILYDVRKTISELVVDVFYKTLKEEANAHACQFSAECVSPTMLSDGMMHYKNTDIPMGEYWLQSPTHDKPNDVLDAVSGAHIYGKNIVQAESFTQLRMMFDEHPEMLKTLQDRHYALGINRLSYHVWALNPWLNRKPGMTLDGIGLYFQRDQTWWKLGKAWVDYAQRCQSLLQVGKPVVDIAVFTGEELPRRAILPDRLVPFLPGIFGDERVESEKRRLANVGEPTHQMPAGVNHSVHLTTAENWVNSLRGYAYDSFNPDVLLHSAKVKDGRIVLDNGMSYAILVVPGHHPMQPNAELMSKAVVDKIIALRNQGATILMGEKPNKTMDINDMDSEISWNTLKNDFVKLPYTHDSFDALGVERDFEVAEGGVYAKDIAYAHRQGKGVDIYFVSNQKNEKRRLDISLRVDGSIPELWNPVTGEIQTSEFWSMNKGRTNITLSLDAAESMFVVLREPTDQPTGNAKLYKYCIPQKIENPWTVTFDEAYRGPSKPVVFDALTDWSRHHDEQIKYYSGTAIYKNKFRIKDNKLVYCYLQIDDVANMASVTVNGISCGTIWAKPYKVDISKAIKKGENTIEIEVANTWANRIMGDEDFGVEPDDSKKIWTNARYRKVEKKLVKSGLIGNVNIICIEDLK